MQTSTEFKKIKKWAIYTVSTINKPNQLMVWMVVHNRDPDLNWIKQVILRKYT